MNNVAPPQTLSEALTRARQLCSLSDLEELRTASDVELVTKFHFGLAHTLRSELNLWQELPTPLLHELSEVSGLAAWEADSISHALLLVLRQQLQDSAQNQLENDA